MNLGIEKITRRKQDPCYTPALWNGYASNLLVTEEETDITVTMKGEDTIISFKARKTIDPPIFNIVLSEGNAKRVLQGLQELDHE